MPIPNQVFTEQERAAWGDGPWQDEPSRMVYDEGGFTVAIQRSALGSLCGYIVIPRAHPWHGKDYDDNVLENVSVHGGLTYSLPYVVDDELLWVLGFDCAHAWDVVPRFHNNLGFAFFTDESTYKGISYVRKELSSLAEQANQAVRKRVDDQ